MNWFRTKKLTCPNCGNTDKKSFKHLDTMRVISQKENRLSRRIYQCPCGEIFTFQGHYDGGEFGGFVIKDDRNTLKEGFEMLDNEYMEDDKNY